jgi:hypothetical protein
VETAANANQPQPQPQPVRFLKIAIKDVPEFRETPQVDSRPADKTTKEQHVSYQLRDGSLLEAIASFEGLAFFHSSKGVLAEVREGNKLVVPPTDLSKLFDNGTVKLPCGTEEYGSTAELVRELEAFLHKYCDVPRLWEKLIAHYCLMTWVYEKFSALPYLRFQGEPGTGKSRIQQVASQLCYKPISVGGSITGPGMFRIIDRVRGTLVVDEAEFAHSDMSDDITKVLNGGYSKGFAIIRCIGENFDPTSFVVFGPKIITNRQAFQDAALETRCVTLHTKEAALRSDVPLQLPPEFEKEGLRLRNRLLLWRFRNFNQTVPDEATLRSPAAGLSPRLAQIATPLYTVAVDESFRKQLIDFFKCYAAEQKTGSDAWAVVCALASLCKGQKSATSFTVGEVAAALGRHSSAHGFDPKWTPHKTGGILRSLGLEAKRGNRGYRFTITPKKLAELVLKYPQG